MAVLNKRAIVTSIEMYGVTAIRLGRTLNPALDALIKALFSLGEQGFAYDPNDLTTLYQDAAGTIPVTGAGQPVGLMLDKSKGLQLDSELILNGSFSQGSTGWGLSIGAVVAAGVMDLSVQYALAEQFHTVTNGDYVLFSYEVLSSTNAQLYLSSTGYVGVSRALPTTVGKYSQIVKVVDSTKPFRIVQNASSAVMKLTNLSVRKISGNHAYQSQSAMRPLLVAAPQRLDYDTADDKLTTTLPAQLTGCTIIRSVPNVGTQILTNQTIPTPYNDNIDHCGLIVINRALTATETAQITKLFNKAAGV